MKALDIYHEYCRLERMAADIKKQADELKRQLIYLVPAGTEKDGIRHTVIERGSVKYKGLLDAVCMELPEAKALADERKALYTSKAYIHNFVEVL